ncbi:MAG: FAD-dependent oxidoreductase [Kofleriaceae bacterium]
MPSVDVDIVILGGGLLGMCIAALVSQDAPDRDVLVCRLSDRQVPHADTLRNQSWLQSGLRYFKAGQLGDRFRFAKRMYAARKALHDAVAFPLPTGIGVFRMRDEAEATELVARAQQFGVSVQRLDDAQARALLGDTFFESGSPYFVTPETTFEEAAILDELRARVAIRGNAREVAAPVTLVQDKSAPCGLVLDLGSVSIRAATTILAAGAGNIPLLGHVGLQSELQIDTTPLLVITDGAIVPKARVFVDRVRECSVICHPPSAALPKGSLVIGVDGTTQRDVAFAAPAERRIPVALCERLWAALPSSLRASHATQSRVTAGFEVKHRGAMTSSEPWISPGFDGFPGLVAAIPGRATLSMSVASDVVARVRSAGRHQLEHFQEPHWTDAIHMHHTPFYDRMNDREAGG